MRMRSKGDKGYYFWWAWEREGGGAPPGCRGGTLFLVILLVTWIGAPLWQSTDAEVNARQWRPMLGNGGHCWVTAVEWSAMECYAALWRALEGNRGDCRVGQKKNQFLSRTMKYMQLQ
jgi:hypothetical protein